MNQKAGNSKLKDKRILFAGVIILIIAIVGSVSFINGGNETKKTVKKEEKPEKGIGVYSSLTGEEIQPDTLKRRPIAVMIENYWEARPQSGLDKADIVYEVLAEGGITRFLAIYQQNDATEIGPVRSARPYFLQIAMEYNPIYVHVGGSSTAIKDIEKLKITDVDEMQVGKMVFYRSTDRVAPHNAYTSTEKIQSYAMEKDLLKSSFLSQFEFLKNGEVNKGGIGADKIVIHYPTKENTIIYDYDQVKKLYNRSHLTGIHTDKVSGQQLTAKNILIQYTETKLDKDGIHMDISIVGTGKAIMISEGKFYTGTWSKKGISDKTFFYDENGKKFKLNPGQTWIEVVPRETNVEI